MNTLLTRRLALLTQPANRLLLTQSQHGIERECLRVAPDGQLALTPHPHTIGSALTHPRITTDYSEALLEFVTETHPHPAGTLDELDAIHRFVYQQIDNEYLWSPSMPGLLPDETAIPIAEYGLSNIGRLKHVYRHGLAIRYGRTMQCIAGIHYNFSFPEALWPLLQEAEDSHQCLRDGQSAGYFALIRNFHRYSWLLMYLFGASPALDASFLRGNSHQLQSLDADTLFLPWATSLRMSDLGYQNNAQASLTPCYNELDAYTHNLLKAVATPYPPYVALGTHHNGQWQQLNTNILQIENEYYSSIRPKRVVHPGERPAHALIERGIQYIEVRCMDINPFLPLGISEIEACFLDTFLLFCALQESPLITEESCKLSKTNFLATVTAGRQPGLSLQRNAQAVPLVTWGKELLHTLEDVAALLDQAYESQCFSHALALQQAKLDDASLTPSAQMLAELQTTGERFRDFALRHSKAHAKAFQQRPLEPASLAEFTAQARQSLARQQALENSDNVDFNQFVADYQANL